jgi:hypothetical protein
MLFLHLNQEFVKISSNLSYFETDSMENTKKPFNSIMELLENRKRSFIDKSWDQTIPVSVDELSEAGFYYTGENDMVECFYCSLGVNGWDEEDHPWKAHAKYAPICHFLKLNKSQQFIEDCQENYQKSLFDYLVVSDCSHT